MAEPGTIESLQEKISEMRKAQEIFATYSQAQVDAIFQAVAMEGSRQRLALARQAIAETGMGILEDKVMKNHYAAEFVYNKYRHMKTCGVIAEDRSLGIQKIAEPVGVIGAIVPITNPTSTAIFKILICLKSRNAILISPHPGAKKCTCEAVRLLAEAAYGAGAPAGIIACVGEPSVELSRTLMASVDFILATGGPDMVRAAYASGKPAIGGGSGNCPVIVDETADIENVVYSTIQSKTFDSGMLCTSEQAMIVVGTENYRRVKEELAKQNAHILTADELAKVQSILLREDGTVSPAIIGQRATAIARLAGFEVSDQTKLLVGEVASVEPSEPFAHEKLSPLLALYRASTFHEALEQAGKLIAVGGLGHTAALWIDPLQEEHIKLWCTRLKSCRLILNSPASQGGIGDLCNFGLAPSLTLGCGSWGGSSLSANVGPEHLLNIKTVAEQRDPMLWLRLPAQVSFQKGCTAAALKEWQETYDCRRIFLITDRFLHQNGNARPILDQLEQMRVSYASFYDLDAVPTLQSARKGLADMEAFQPDGIIGLGGGGALDAAKLMWYFYEHPEAELQNMESAFLDIRKRIFKFPPSGKKAVFAAIATTAGSGAENTPFALIVDEGTGFPYSVADYELLPTVAIVDADNMMDLPKGLTRTSGIGVLAHGLEAYVSPFASDYTDGFALLACRNVFRYLPRAYDRLGQDREARIKLADAAALAGIAQGNAFPGLGHAMAFQLSAWHHLPHGLASALVLLETMDYNARKAPEKLGALSWHKCPRIRERYGEVAAFCGFGGETADESYAALYQKVAELKRTIEIYPTIQEYGVDEKYYLDTLDAMTEAAWKDQCTGYNPVCPLLTDVRELYLRSYYGAARYEAMRQGAVVPARKK